MESEPMTDTASSSRPMTSSSRPSTSAHRPATSAEIELQSLGSESLGRRTPEKLTDVESPMTSTINVKPKDDVTSRPSTAASRTATPTEQTATAMSAASPTPSDVSTLDISEATTRVQPLSHDSSPPSASPGPPPSPPPEPKATVKTKSELTSKAESSKSETPEAETSKDATSKAESSKTETSKSESLKAESSKSETPLKSETSKTANSKAESSKSETPKPGTSKTVKDSDGLKTVSLQVPTRSAVTFASEPSTSSDLMPRPRSAKKSKRWNAVAEARARKGFVIRLKRMMGCGSSLDAMYDDPMPVVVFGATGLVGGAVARALLRDKRFEVKAVTRTPTTDVARKLAEEGAIIVPADLNDTRSLTRAVEGAHAVFLVTHYWEHMNKQKEITQGKNCVDAAVSAGVAHFIFYGSESPQEALGSECGYMDAKAAIENYVKNTTLPYTALRLPFYFENFLGVFKPHQVRPGIYAVALPMEDKAMECVSVRDVGQCVVNVLLRPKAHLCRVLPVTAEKLTVQQITDTFNKHFSDRKFICPRIRVKDYETFDFDGAKDIATMFEFYQLNREVHEAKVSRRVQGPPLSFDRWVADNKQKLAESMNVPDKAGK